MSANGTNNGRGTLRLADARQMTPPVDRLGERAQKARDAIADAVSNDDLAEIMRKQVEKAKAGDVGSAKFVLDQIAGKTPSMQVTVGVRGQAQQPREEPPQRIVYQSEPTGPRERSVGESRKIVAKYLAKNGPTRWIELAELFLIDEECEDSVLGHHEWFELTAAREWHLTATGRRECGA